MTEVYTAPTNGHEIRNVLGGGLCISKPGMDYVAGHEPQTLVAGRVESLREYFQDERDRKLGRERRQGIYLVYASESGKSVRIVNDLTGKSWEYAREPRSWPKGGPSLVASTWWADNPEKKPWHDANPGEVWVLTYDCEEVVATLEKNGSWKRFDGEFESSGDLQYVRSARRIWPESKES